MNELSEWTVPHAPAWPPCQKKVAWPPVKSLLEAAVEVAAGAVVLVDEALVVECVVEVGE